MVQNLQQRPFEWIAELGLAIPRPNDELEANVRAIRARATSALSEYPLSTTLSPDLEPATNPPERSVVATPPPPYRSPSPKIARTRSESYQPSNTIPVIHETSGAPESPPASPPVAVRRKPVPPTPAPPPAAASPAASPPPAKMLARTQSIYSDSYKEVVINPMSDMDTLKEVAPSVPQRSSRRPTSQPDWSIPIQVTPPLEPGSRFLTKDEERVRDGLIPRAEYDPPFAKIEDDDATPQPPEEPEPTSYLELTRRRNQRRSMAPGSQRRASIQSQSTTSLPSPEIQSPIEQFSPEDPSSFMRIREREQKKMSRDQKQYPSPPSSAPPSVRVASPPPKYPSPQSSVSKSNPLASTYPPQQSTIDKPTNLAPNYPPQQSSINKPIPQAPSYPPYQSSTSKPNTLNQQYAAPPPSVGHAGHPAPKHDAAGASGDDSYLAMIRQRNRRRRGTQGPTQGNLQTA